MAGAPVLWSPASAPLRLGEGGGIHAPWCVPTIINQNLAKLKFTCILKMDQVFYHYRPTEAGVENPQYVIKYLSIM